MKLKESLNRNDIDGKNKNIQTIGENIFDNIKKDPEDIKTLKIIYSPEQDAGSITNLFKHYYRNSRTIGLFHGIYRNLKDGKKDEAISNLKKAGNYKPYSPREILFISKRDHILHSDKLLIFEQHIDELDKIYDKFITFKKDRVENIINMINQEEGISEALINKLNDFTYDLSIKFHKIILYFETLEFEKSTQGFSSSNNEAG